MTLRLSRRFHSARLPRADHRIDVVVDATSTETFRASLARIKQHRQPFPSSVTFPEPKLLITGEREVLDANDEFRFACTACGRCCHRLPKSVMLDSYDLFLISRSLPLGLIDRTTRALHRQYRRAFSFTLAGIEASASTRAAVRNEMMISDDETSTSTEVSFVPAAMLDVKESTGNCFFAAPVDYHGPNPTVSTRTAAADRPRRSHFGLQQRRTGLTCRLGRLHQPMACALYPLGELFNEPNQPHYYSLDPVGCEGVDRNNSHSNSESSATPQRSGVRPPLRSVSEYLHSQDYVTRRAEWQWFRSKLTLVAQRRIFDDHTLSTDDAALLLESMMAIFYDFDSVPCIEQRARPVLQQSGQSSAASGAGTAADLSEWLSIRAAIDDAVTQILAMHSDHRGQPAHWRQVMSDAGLLVIQR